MRSSRIALGALMLALGPSAPARAADQEVVPTLEPVEIQGVVKIIEGAIALVHAGGARPSHRDAHAKGHGCVKAEVAVADDVPGALRHGVFAEPHTFAAWIRFSNSSGSPQSDVEGDGRGMAIKLMGVPGRKLLAEEADATTQDFVMINHPVFFIRNVSDYLPFVSMVLAGRMDAFFAKHPQEKRIFAAFNATPVSNVLRQRFYSGSPYRLGPNYVKFSAIPVACTTRAQLADEAGSGGGQDFLREGLANWLKDKDACFDFAVQPQRDPVKQPIEDATVLWDEADAPFVKVASIRIPKQVFDTPAQQTFCENLSYTPWHALPAHEPVGGINRMRKSVYGAISKLRHKLNAAPRAEPTGQETFP